VFGSSFHDFTFKKGLQVGEGNFTDLHVRRNGSANSLPVSGEEAEDTSGKTCPLDEGTHAESHNLEKGQLQKLKGVWFEYTRKELKGTSLQGNSVFSYNSDGLMTRYQFLFISQINLTTRKLKKSLLTSID
jgi:hypothetical protein